MLSRRSVLLASLAAGVAMSNKAHARAAQPATPVNFDVPLRACDCHTHIHGDPEKFPFFAGRVYTPELASPEEMAALHKSLHIERVVIVTPSVYGTDNSSTLFGMKARGANARGVAVIDDKTPESALDAMHQDGFRGVRLNLATGGVNDPNVGRPRFTAAVERMKARGWHVQLYTTLPMISAIKDLVETAPVPVVFDHFGGLEASRGLEQPGFSDLVALVKSGKGLCQDFGRLSLVNARARLQGHCAVRAGADHRERGPHRLGHRLAASGFEPRRGTQANRRRAALPDRRRASPQSASGVGTGRGCAQENPGRQSGAALRILIRHTG
ncbi:putative TIM-barrel fold metal-dependent hydrolase [Bradyrhizobium sp. LM6.9]